MFVASVLSMFAGAEVVHQYYRPDLVCFKDITVTFIYIYKGPSFLLIN